MPQQLQVGVATVVSQTTTFAMPARACIVSAGAAVQGSTDGSTWTADITAVTNSAVFWAFPFIRCNGGSTTIIAKPND